MTQLKAKVKILLNFVEHIGKSALIVLTIVKTEVGLKKILIGSNPNGTLNVTVMGNRNYTS